MTLLPVVARELRVASRRSWTYWSRVIAGGLALALVSWLALVEKALRMGGSGEPLFYALAGSALGFTFLAGILYSADSVSSEKRDGTLGLLFLTDLRGWDVALGKLAGTSLGAVYGLIAMLPLMALTLLLGGITGADYWRMVLVLLLTLFCSLSLGLLASVLTVDLRGSVLLAFLLMLGVTFGAWLLIAAVSWGLRHAGWLAPFESAWQSSWVRDATPFSGFMYASSSMYKGDAGRYWTAIGFTGGLGLLALGLASWRLPHAWQEKTSETTGRGFRGFLERLRFPRASDRARFRAAVLDVNAITWLTARFWLRPWLVWGFLAGVIGVVYWIGASEGGDWWDAEVGLTVSVLVHVTLKLWIANEAPRQFLEDRRSGAMELLLSTPLTTPEIVHGRWLALRRQFLGPIAFVLAVDLYWLWWGTATRPNADSSTFAGMWLIWMAMLLLDFWALGWAGLWAGMTSRGRATTTFLIGRVLVLPWLGWFFGMTLFVVGQEWLGAFNGLDSDVAMWLVLGIWFLLGAGNDLLWASHAKSAFRSSFREAATTRPGAARRWFRRKEKTMA